MSKHEIIPCPAFLTQPQRVSLGKSGHAVDVNVNRLSADVLAHIFAYGLRQCLNDAAAPGKTEGEKLGLFNKRLESLYAGTLRAARETDPVAREAKRIATDYLARKGIKLDAEGYAAKLAKAQASPAVQALAQAAVERAKGLDLAIDL